MPEYWIQIENRPWDICPHNIDRMTGQTIEQVEQNHPAPVTVTLTSINGGASRNVKMYKPIRDGSGNIIDALILRRYKAPVKADKSDAWTVPDDRKINPWDLNEPNPTETGTMGTVPGATLEASVGDSIIVHFRNRDHRLTTTGKPMAIEHRCHSLHPHGVVFAPASDGAYPLSPADPNEPLGTEAALWAMVPQWGGGQFKQGDRVPPDATFTYTWNTFGWPTTAGVWLYHDHSICDDDNVNLGAIGMIVIHNPKDQEQEVDTRLAADPTQPDPTLMPGGSPNGSPLFSLLIPLPLAEQAEILPHQVADLRPAAHMLGAAHEAAHVLRLADNAELHLNPALLPIQLSFLRYRTPPAKAQILQLFHTLYDGSTCINGRQYLGNTPTVVSGPSTLMRFGVVGMGSEFHTFHIHGHRWTLPGPSGANLTSIMESAQIGAVSQFEDTRTFGPANSFVFTINELAPLAPGSFMRAGGPGPTDPVGEWHMHCHVLMHMMTGMMGSLLIVKGGEFFTALPKGVPCPPMDTAAPPAHPVHVVDFTYNPQTINISAGDTVHWVWQANDHSVTSDVSGQFDSGVNNTGHIFDHMFMSAGTFNYHCAVHGQAMHGTVVVT
jgi:plastocyanin